MFLLNILDNLLNFITSGYYYSIYTCPAETFRESNCCVVFLITLFYPLSFCDKKGE
jgi:hypothetical protein